MSRASRGRRLFATAFAVLALSLARPAQAHRVNVFAYVEGDTVHVECSYSRSSRVRSGDIEVKNAATGKIYLTGKTDDMGNFAFPVPAEARAGRADLSILLRAGEGHGNDWTVKADEYLAAAPAPADLSGRSPGVEPAGPAATIAAPAAAPAAAALDPAALQALVEAAVEKKIAPLRNLLLADKEKGPGLTEIAGGVGYLVGIAGLLAYARSRQGKGRA